MAYFCGRLHSRFGDKRDGENENEKKRVWQVAFAQEVTALQRERRVIESNTQQEWDFGERRLRFASWKALARCTSTPRAFEARIT